MIKIREKINVCDKTGYILETILRVIQLHDNAPVCKFNNDWYFVRYGTQKTIEGTENLNRFYIKVEYLK